MTAAFRNPGGAAVGQLADQSPLARYVVLYFRMWCDGPEGQTAVWKDLASGLGETQARSTLEILESLFDCCARHRRRPLMRHAVNCRCLGADEACFAHFVTTATEGDRQDAMLIATLLVRTDVAPIITPIAADLGCALIRMMKRHRPPLHHCEPITATVH
ncbi:hypothetical protein [Yoonia sp. I 8.24]|uniref:hypothetical protein n=1 Tax=Yoonia sp. I 8.24 TaxID=1537229 RepID=UPI001EDFD657|nr:hypothetical protein [Yoonia sp. I 8.24]MCG3269426.1 hypothetical protein [Yoonia sp. I 8.24]